jgi:hypothetical protein
VAPSSLSGALAALQPAAALRRLTLLDLQRASSLAPLAALTQVTRLELTGHWRLMERGGVVLEEVKRGGGTTSNSTTTTNSTSSSSSSSPLSALPHLVSLQLRKVKVSAVLPPNLTQLELYNCDGISQRTWRRLAACQQLQEVVLDVGSATHPVYHPTLVLQALSGRMPQLRLLRINREVQDSYGSEEYLGDILFTMMQRAGVKEEEAAKDGSWWPVPPQGPAQGFQHPEAYVVVPPPNMFGLPSLQTLNLGQQWLVVSSERYWRHLAGCSSLRSLSLHTTLPPPAGVTFPAMEELVITTSTSRGDTLALLAAFPALKEVWLTVVPREDRTAATKVGLVIT